MARDDLLSLSLEDLARLSNRGRVNAARTELADGRLVGEVRETDGGVSVRWADGRATELPAGAPLAKGRCACPDPPVCKHLVALALLYQAQAGEQKPAASGPWNPGAISDEVLARHCRAADLKRARQRWSEGVLAELTRSAQPLARFHVPVCTVRFLVPGEPAHAKCNCQQSPPCEHVALAVWAFRLLAEERTAGIVTAGESAPVPADLLDALEAATREFIEQGVSGLSKGVIDRLTRLNRRCEEQGLIWPAEVVAEWLAQLDAYARHDARFEPGRIAALIGELTARVEALRSRTLPALLVGGSATDREMALEPSEYGGLGCVVRPGRRGVELVGYLYDRKSAQVVAITHETPNASATFVQLAEQIAIDGLAGASFRAVGAGLLQLGGGKRTAGHELKPGRIAEKSLRAENPLEWEQIEPPVRVTDFAALQERLASLPPSCLRARRVAEDFHVLEVRAIESARFDHASHTVQAILVDGGGHRALLEHPYTSRGAAGVSALLHRLTVCPVTVSHVSGVVRRSASGLVINPAGLVCQENTKRVLLQPWIEGKGTASSETNEALPPTEDATADYLAELSEQLGELLLLGLGRADVPLAQTWADLGRRGESVGFARLSARVNDLAARLAQKAHTLTWDASAAAAIVAQLAMLARLARDVG